MAIGKDREERLKKIEEILSPEYKRLTKSKHEKGVFTTHDEIMKELDKCGFSFSRSTISKDLNFLGIKPNKKTGYYQSSRVLNLEKEQSRFSSIFKNSKIEYHTNCDYIVLKTKLGYAEIIATRLKKHSALKEMIIGTICSSDCIILFCKNSNLVEEHLKQFK